MKYHHSFVITQKMFSYVTAYRQWSNRVFLAYKLVLASALFWILVVGHRLIFYTNATGFCTTQEGVYALFDTYLEAFLSGICSPLIVIALAFLLLRNVRSVMKRRVRPGNVAATELNGNFLRLQRIDSQLTLMLFLQSLVAIIAYVPYATAVLYFNITGTWNKSSVRQAWEQLIGQIIRLCSYLFASTGFYISMMSNCGFRKQFMRSFGIKRVIDLNNCMNRS